MVKTEAYDADLKVTPRKEYVEDFLIHEVIHRYDILPDDLPAITRKLEEWSGDQWGIDDNGIYWYTTMNPIGKWDSWILHDLNKDIYTITTLPDDLIASALITSDGTWHDLQYPDAKAKSLKDEIMGYKIEYSNYLIASLDCHI